MLDKDDASVCHLTDTSDQKSQMAPLSYLTVLKDGMKPEEIDRDLQILSWASRRHSVLHLTTQSC
jgi:hypothetical protein